jgi:hypothetical protein
MDIKKNIFFSKLNFWLVAVSMLLLVYFTYARAGYAFTGGVLGKVACISGILAGYLRRDVRISMAGFLIFLLSWILE